MRLQGIVMRWTPFSSVTEVQSAISLEVHSRMRMVSALPQAS